MLKVSVYTDGSCLGNPGVGGFAAIICIEDSRKKICGYSKNTKDTAPRMELYAPICALDWLNKNKKEPCDVTFYTDSKIIIDASKHSDMSLMAPERKNHDLWKQYIKLRNDGKHKITFVKVPAHSDCHLNNEADKLAKAMAKKARHLVYGG